MTMKKIYLTCIIAMAALTSCVTPTKFSQAFGFIDYGMFPGMFLTESNSVSFEYQPIASLYAEEISGEYKVQKATKKVKNNEIYGDFYESGPTNYRQADPQSALAYAIEKAKAMGGNGIINLNIRRTGSGYCVTGMVIKR